MNNIVGGDRRKAEFQGICLSGELLPEFHSCSSRRHRRAVAVQRSGRWIGERDPAVGPVPAAARDRAPDRSPGRDRIDAAEDELPTRCCDRNRSGTRGTSASGSISRSASRRASTVGRPTTARRYPGVVPLRGAAAILQRSHRLADAREEDSSAADPCMRAMAACRSSMPVRSSGSFHCRSSRLRWTGSPSARRSKGFVLSGKGAALSNETLKPRISRMRRSQGDPS